MRSAMPMIAAALASSCSGGSQELSFTIADNTYRVPADQTVSVRLQPQKFVMIKAPMTSFELLFDDGSQGLTDPFGWPVIPMMNNSAAANISRQAAGDLKVVCRRGGASWSDCAFKVRHAQAEWVVRFPYGQLEDAQAMRAKAIKLLDTYRVSA